MRIITIATADYVANTRRLRHSLGRSGTSYELTIYCDEPAGFAGLGEAVELPEIRSMGVKRAKFTAYERALEGGPFLYLDSDIIALEDLAPLAGHDQLAACPDDLSACPFIADKRRPWPDDPELVADRYFNSGVTWFPLSLREFVRELRALAAADALWSRYTIAGKLYDTHFLCAQVQLRDIPLHRLDGATCNWQGLRLDGAVRRGDQLFNQRTGELIRLVHFAGIRDIDAYLCSLPPPVGSLLCERGSAGPARLETAFTEVLASFSARFGHGERDPFPATVLQGLTRELLALDPRADHSQRPSYFADPESMASLVYSLPNSEIEWNGLPCGGAYLEGSEYDFLCDVVAAGGVRSVLETGAGFTSILFRRLGLETLAIETERGPWMTRAEKERCAVRLVGFDASTLSFDDLALREALEGFTAAPDLVFIDAPPGTRARSRVLHQLLRYLQPRYVLFHDAHRDAANLLSYEQSLGLRFACHFPSQRGAVLYGPPLALPSRSPSTVLDDARVRLQLAAHLPAFSSRREAQVRLEIANEGKAALSSRSDKPVNVSYHWFDERSCVVFDGRRTPLPFELRGGSRARFPVTVESPPAPGTYRCQIVLVQESVRWFDGPEQGLSFSVAVA